MINLLLFKDWHIQPILRGEKTQTRRVWKAPRAKVGSVHLAKTQMLSEYYFAKLRILKVEKQRLGDISEEDAMKEGGYTLSEFKNIWIQINGDWNPDLEVYVVEFKLELSNLKFNDIVKLSPECGEHTIHGDIPWRVISDPHWWCGNEMIWIKSCVKTYYGFATKFLEFIDRVDMVFPGDAYNRWLNGR
jgi:uncharacterized protein YqfB (UPF0267 family)